MFKKTKLVMLPTNEATNIVKLEVKEVNHSKLVFTKNPKEYVWGFQHLYFLSDEEIKEGDWVYNTVINELIKVDKEQIEFWNGDLQNTFIKKIIASTDKSLIIDSRSSRRGTIDYSLPRPSDLFIKKYCELGGIDEVMVEYRRGMPEWHEGKDYTKYNLKVAPDNTITIKAIKDNYSREEVKDLIMNSFSDLAGGMSYNEQELNKWIEENL